MIMTLEDHKTFLCPKSIASNSRAGCQGPRCAAFRLYKIDIVIEVDKKPMKIRSYSCGLIPSDVELINEQQLFQKDYNTSKQQKVAVLHDDLI